MSKLQQQNTSNNSKNDENHFRNIGKSNLVSNSKYEYDKKNSKKKTFKINRNTERNVIHSAF